MNSYENDSFSREYTQAPDSIQTLKSSLDGIGGNHQTRLQRLTQLKTQLKDSEGIELDEQISTIPDPEALISHLDFVLENEELPENISQVEDVFGTLSALLHASERMLEEIESTALGLRSKKFSTRSSIDKLRFSLEELNNDIRPKQLFTFFERRRLKKQLVKAGDELEGIRANIKESDELVEQLRPKIARLRDRLDTLYLVLARDVLEKERDEYIEATEAAVSNEDLTTSVRKNFMELAVRPLFVKLSIDKSVTQDEATEFWDTLQVLAGLTDNEPPHDDGELAQFIMEHDQFSDLRYILNDIFNNEDRRQTIQFLSDRAYAHLRELMEEVSSTVSQWQHITTLRREIMQPFSRSSPQNRSGSDWIPKMEMWRAYKSTPEAQVLFADQIEEFDEEIYQHTLTSSLRDREGREVDRLEYYPTPPAILRLVLLAAADYREHRTVHANWVLTNLAKRPDWPTLLDAAVAEFPQLLAVRPVLEDWEFNDPRNNPKLRKNINSFALTSLDEFDDDNLDPQLLKLTTESIPNDALIVRVTQDGFITLAQGVEIQKAIDILKSEDYDESYFLSNAVRDVCKGLLAAESEDKENWLKFLLRIHTVAQRTLEASTEYERGYYNSKEVVELLLKASDAHFDTVIDAPQHCPALVSSDVKGRALRALISTDYERLLNKDSLEQLQRVYKLFPNLRPLVIIELMKLLLDGELTEDTLATIKEDAIEMLVTENFFSIKNYPKLFFSDVAKGKEIYLYIRENYGRTSDQQSMIRALGRGDWTYATLKKFTETLPILQQDDWRSTQRFIISNINVIARNEADFRFISQFIGKFGKVADQLLRDYTRLVKVEPEYTNPENQQLILDFLEHFRVLSGPLLHAYKKARDSGTERIFLSGINSLAEKLTGAGQISEEDRQKPYYDDLIRAVYSNNSGNWTNYASNNRCGDREQDHEGLQIRQRYQMDLLSAAQITVKEGEEVDRSLINELTRKVMGAATQIEAHEYDMESARAEFEERVSQYFEQLKKSTVPESVTSEKITTTEEKLLLLFTDHLYGNALLSENEIHELSMLYQFIYYEDVREYIQGTNDRVTRSNNPDYALLCELHEFFADKIKEVHRTLTVKGWENEAVVAAMESYYKQLSNDLAEARLEEQLNKLNLSKLGLTDSFIKQIGRMLERRSGREYSAEQVKQLIARYESFTDGFAAESSTSNKGLTKGVYGALKSQRQKTSEAAELLTGQSLEDTGIMLHEVDVNAMLEQRRSLMAGEYDPDQFANYTAQQLLSLFGDDRSKIERELGKFESEQGVDRQVLHGYISKTKETAHARMVGGVCVAGDNPSGEKQNLWDMENYTQLVLQDPETLRCQGLCLLHLFEVDGKRIVTASLNPSSTYLYSVDERALFDSLLNTLATFAEDNNIDIICTSKHKQIRTNRTGGKFEAALENQIDKVGKTFSFPDLVTFSYSPAYKMKEMDVVWENKSD